MGFVAVNIDLKLSVFYLIVMILPVFLAGRREHIWRPLVAPVKNNQKNAGRTNIILVDKNLLMKNKSVSHLFNKVTLGK